MDASGYVISRVAPLWVLGSDPAGESGLIYTWSVASAPAGGLADIPHQRQERREERHGDLHRGGQLWPFW